MSTETIATVTAFQTDQAQPVVDAIRSAAVSRATGDDVPILRGIRLTVDDGELTAVATDRYRMTRATTPVTTGDGFNVVLDGDGVTRLLKALPKRTATGKGEQGPMTVTVSDSGESVMFEWGWERASMSVAVAVGEYPAAVDKSGDREPAAIEQVRINTKYLADLGKHVTERRAADIPTWTFTGPNKMARADWVAYGVTYRYVVQPARIES